MPATLDARCPTCGKQLKVPAELAGRTIRCKNCQTAFPAPAPARPAAATPAKPVAAKPAKPAADPAAPIPFADDPPKGPADDDNEANPYGVIKDDLDVPRCPFCAQELDPPDTKVCLSCGYDLLQRRRHESKKVYDLTAGDYLLHWLPGVACLLVVAGMVALAVVCGLNMRDWLTGSFLDQDEKDPITQQTKFFVPPFCFNIWICLIAAFVSFKAGKFAVKRLIINWKPAEVIKKT